MGWGSLGSFLELGRDALAVLGALSYHLVDGAQPVAAGAVELQEQAGLGEAELAAGLAELEGLGLVEVCTAVGGVGVAGYMLVGRGLEMAGELAARRGNTFVSALVGGRAVSIAYAQQGGASARWTASARADRGEGEVEISANASTRWAAFRCLLRGLGVVVEGPVGVPRGE